MAERYPETLAGPSLVGRVPAGPADHPVTWVDLDDARAYCAWAGTRLPTGPEWQWAAQGPDGRAWPQGRHLGPGALQR